MSDRLGQWKSSLLITRETTFRKIANLLGVSEITEDFWNNLESLLIQADLGFQTTKKIIDELKDQTKHSGWKNSDEIKPALQIVLRKRVNDPQEISLNQSGLSVILIVGVNGTGKTTSVAKLANLFKSKGLKVVLAATDTFRAAGIEQLQNWGRQLDIRVVAGQPNGDPGSVAFDAIQSALARKEDVLLVDTAGRLHTRFNLMEELKKVHRVVGKAMPGAPHEVLLVMDATTGQNAFHQAQAFKDSVHVTGIILAKLDSSARGGMAFAIQEQLELPIYYAGLGEGIDDLQPFDPEAFVDGILVDFG
ncbi:MAG: signal recognition particle-docking protein FtsY [Anaerolineales bacterium]|jgi:fused signal recognition particle receptor